jgi:hypothetical protein
MEQDESEYEAWKESIANLDHKQKKKAVKKKFTKLQEEHQTLKGAKARGKLAVAEMKGCDWLHKKVAGLKNPREVEKSTAGRKKETSTKIKISVSEYYCYILLSIIINYILLSIIINYILLSIIISYILLSIIIC